MRFGRWSVLLLACLTVSCPDDDDDDIVVSASCWCVPDVASVKIVPGQFDVAPGSTFELRARLFAADGTEIPEFFSYAPLWTITAAANVSVLRRDGHTVVLEVPSNIGVGAFDVTAEAGTAPGVASAPATARVISTAPADDYIDADPHSNGKPLSVALAADAASTTWDVTPVAFSGFGDLGDMRSGGGAMVFSADRAMAYSPVSWTTSPNFMRYKVGADAVATAQQDPHPPLVKDVTIWIDPYAGGDQWTATTAEAVARIHVADATKTFLKNRLGVEFKVKAVYRIISGTPEDHCYAWTDAPVKGEPFGGGTPVEFDPASNDNAIDIFVFNVPLGTGASCLDSDGSGYRIFLNAMYTLPNVVGHELGHVMLRMDDMADHGDGMLMGPTNLMVQGDDDRGAPRRSHLSIGQACQMNLSAMVSLLRAAASLPVPTVCPPVTKDVP